MDCFKNLILDEERALYGIKDAEVVNCAFKGPKDGESALKECRNIVVKNCVFDLRYPLWHLKIGDIFGIKMNETCRAPLWYDQNITISSSFINGVKALRECEGVSLLNTNINSIEFGWMCNKVNIENITLVGEYPFFHSSNLKIEKLNLKGKYSFQYIENMEIRDSYLDTKDAFWHTNNVTVYDSIIKGEYLAWFSKNLRLVRCKIIGTQPFCYCENLILEECTMEDCDLAFENSSVKATVRSEILSVKNPITGFIHADKIKEIILDEHLLPGSNCDIKSLN